MNELLLIKTPDATTTSEAIGSKLTILQSFSPRLHEVEGSPNDVTRAAALPGVIAGPAIESSDLSQAEQLALDAWRLRLEGKTRPYDGNNWGSKDFEPP